MKKKAPEFVTTKLGNIQFIDRVSILALALQGLDADNPLQCQAVGLEINKVQELGLALGYSHSEIATALDIVQQELLHNCNGPESPLH